MNKRVAATILVAAIGGGSTAGVVLTHVATAATGDGSTTTAPSATTAPARGAAAAPAAPADRTKRRTDELTAALQGLVDNGTITAAQRDAIIQALLRAEPAKGADEVVGRGPGIPGLPGIGIGRGGILGTGLDAAAKALGTDAAALRQALVAGKSIADVAKDKGVSVDTVVAAVVAAETTEIDKAVTDGKITQALADQLKTSLTPRVTDVVNGKLPAGPGGFGGFGHGPRPGKADPSTTPTTAKGSSATPAAAGATTA